MKPYGLLLGLSIDCLITFKGHLLFVWPTLTQRIFGGSIALWLTLFSPIEKMLRGKEET